MPLITIKDTYPDDPALGAVMEESSLLMTDGKHEEAAAKLIAFFRERLPEGHPSKEQSAKGVIQGDAVSALNAFETVKTNIEDTSRFGSVLTRMLEQARYHNYWHILGSCLITYFRDERPDLLRHFTNHMLKDVEKVDGFLAKAALAQSAAQAQSAPKEL